MSEKTVNPSLKNLSSDARCSIELVPDGFQVGFDCVATHQRNLVNFLIELKQIMEKHNVV